MLVANWMTKDVTTLTPDRSMMKASKIMKDRHISCLPIVDEDGRLVGIVSDRDIKDASPSKATTLDMHELYYLLSEIKIKDIMTKKVVTIRDDETVEKAATLMLEGHFGSLPVVDAEGRVVGIMTDTDVFKVLVEISGVYEGGTQVCLQIGTEPGTLSPVLAFLKEHRARIMNIMTHNVPEDEGMKNVYIRIRDMEKPDLKRLKADMEAQFKVLYWAVDPVHRVV
ncbi:CBS and ACT domain-containing protein [Pseudodesulfovibrio sp.]|uniref:CBS and ACT domain-containing protein n=1 Tax=Pseudodesulfovibrio sp. TaxID=2035812 RepID=UPI002614B584|nr:CBS and ACT domain-containing protein [Pseudodesulfovibrio sp.]MDD3312562.1 CBS and ACT domain-containing protein [Pseudodesulfovibrio sp.]